MAFTFGFYNSLNGDRKYNAEQVSAIFDGLIKDGVYDTIGELFAVKPAQGMQITVGTGRAWFNHTWNDNDSVLPLFVDASDITLDRYDTVVLEVNAGVNVRTNTIKIVKGIAATEPAKPELVNTADVHQHPLAHIRVKGGADAITESMIQVVVGTSECPFVTGIIQTASIDALFQQWNGEFDEWFENVKAQLEGDIVTNLQRQIDANRDRIEDVKVESLEAMSNMEYEVPDSILTLWGIKSIVGNESKKFKDVLNGVFKPTLRTRTQTFTSNQTYTIHENVATLMVLCCGGGGGGGGGYGNYSDSKPQGGGSGGGGGTIATRTFQRIEISTRSVPITIGAAGTGGLEGKNGMAGGTTSFGTYLSASGGHAGGAGNRLSMLSGYGGHGSSGSGGNGVRITQNSTFGGGGGGGGAGGMTQTSAATSGSNTARGLGGSGRTTFISTSNGYGGAGGQGGVGGSNDNVPGCGGGGGGGSYSGTGGIGANGPNWNNGYMTPANGGDATNGYGCGGGGGSGGGKSSSYSNQPGGSGGKGRPGICIVQESWYEWRYQV